MILVLNGILAVTAFYWMCTGFQPHDDFGYVMLTQKIFFAGHPLYDQTFTQYGPAFYAYSQLLLSITRLPLTHDTTLLITAASWVAISLLCSLYVARMTRSPLLSAFACLATFALLRLLRNEPGHPQELCAILLTGVVFASSFIQPGRSLSVLLGMIGFFIGLLGMTKVNLGVFATLSLCLTVVTLAPAGRLRSLLLAMCSASTLLLPIILMRHRFPEMAGYCLLVTATILVLVLQTPAFKAKDPASWMSLAGAPAGLLAGVVLGVVYTLATGSSFKGLVNGLVIEPMGLDRAFCIPPPFKVTGAIVALAMAAGVYLTTHPQSRLWEKSPWVPCLLKLSAIPVAIPILRVLFVHGTLGYCLPLAAVLAQPLPGQSRCIGSLIPRYFALSLAVLEVMWGYPVWGAQGPLSIFLLIPVWLVSCADAFRYLESVSDIQPRLEALPVSGRSFLLRSFFGNGKGRKIFCYAGSLGLIGVGLFLGKTAASSYRMTEALGLPGATLLHMPHEQAEFYRQLTQAVRANGRTFFSMPGLCSLYFWSAQEPPTVLNAGAWIILFKPEQQAKVVHDLQQTRDLCVVRWNELNDFWGLHIDTSQNQIVRYINENFLKTGSVGGCDILVRRQRGTATSRLTTAFEVSDVARSQ